MRTWQALHNMNDFLCSGPGLWYLQCVHFSLLCHSLHLSSTVCSTGLHSPLHPSALLPPPPRLLESESHYASLGLLVNLPLPLLDLPPSFFLLFSKIPWHCHPHTGSCGWLWSPCCRTWPTSGRTRSGWRPEKREGLVVVGKALENWAGYRWKLHQWLESLSAVLSWEVNTRPVNSRPWVSALHTFVFIFSLWWLKVAQRWMVYVRYHVWPIKQCKTFHWNLVCASGLWEKSRWKKTSHLRTYNLHKDGWAKGEPGNCYSTLPSWALKSMWNWIKAL